MNDTTAPVKTRKARGTNRRVYVIANLKDGSERLIRASYRHIAREHVARALLADRVASQSDLERLITAGVKVEEAAAAAPAAAQA